MNRIMLTHPSLARDNYYGGKALAALRALGDLRLNPLDRELTVAELAQAAQDCQVIVSFRQTAAGEALFSSLPNLIAYCRCAIDIRNIDVGAASNHGILITQASAGFIASVSEWIIGAMILLARDFCQATEAYHRGVVPIARPGRELRDSTVGIIGYGQIARRLAELCLGFDMRVLVSDPYAVCTDPRITQVSQDQILSDSDFVVCLAVATEETENLMNARAFARMKPGSFFVNASRGNLVDEAALLGSLESGQLAGCALDVGRAPDQMPSPPVARHPLVLATPHIGGLTPAAIEHQAMETVTQVADILAGRIPIGAVNPSQARRMKLAFVDSGRSST